MYTSNAYGLNYSLSLPGNRRAASGKCDFEKVSRRTESWRMRFVVELAIAICIAPGNHDPFIEKTIEGGVLMVATALE